MSLALRSKTTNYQLGVDAENTCISRLKKDGYSILATRYKTKAGEIDIIAANKAEVLFIEVKRRKNEFLDDPVTPGQKKRIINAALQYLGENPQISEMDMRFDCILVDNNLVLTHIKDSWRIEEI